MNINEKWNHILCKYEISYNRKINLSNTIVCNILRKSYILVHLGTLSLRMSHLHSFKIMQEFQNRAYFLDTIFHIILENTRNHINQLQCYNHCNCPHICWHILLRRIRVGKLIAKKKWLEYRNVQDMFLFSEILVIHISV